MADLQEALNESTKCNRVCPLPRDWNRLYEMLPNRQRKGAGWEPAVPLILSAWSDSPDLMKAVRLREHIEWAAAHGALDQVHRFMVALPEDAWHHYGE